MYVWDDVDLRIDSDNFCKTCQISSMNKKARSKIPLKPKAPFKLVFINIVTSTAPKISTSDTTFYNYLLIVDAYSKIPEIYGMEKSQQKKLWTNWICFNPDLGNEPIWMVGLRNFFSRCRYAVYLDGFQRGMSNLRSLSNVIGTGKSRDERTS